MESLLMLRPRLLKTSTITTAGGIKCMASTNAAAAVTRIAVTRSRSGIFHQQRRTQTRPHRCAGQRDAARLEAYLAA